MGVSLPLFFTSSSWAQGCSQNAIDGVIKKLKIDSESSSAMATLRKCGSLAVPQLKDTLKNQDQRVRRGAAMALGEVGSSAKVAVSDLTKVLQDTDLEVRLEAAKAILKIDSDSQAAVLAVIEISKLYDAQVNSIAFAAINQEISPSTVDALIKLLKDKNQPEPLRLYALNAVGYFILPGFTNKPAAKAAVTVLLNILDDKTESESIRSKAISALSQFGSQDKAIIAAFIKVFKNATEPLLRQQAAQALRIEPETPEAKVAVPVFIQVFKDKGEPLQVRNGAVNALLNIKPLGTGAEAKATVDALITVFKDKSDEFRSSGARILGKMGPEAEAAVEPLLKIFEDEKNEEPEIRWEAAKVLGQIGPKAKKAVKPLLKAFENPKEDETVRFKAVEALGGIGSEAEAAIPVFLNSFIELVKNKDPQNRWYTIGEALQKILVALEDQPDSLSMSIEDINKAIEALKLLKAPEKKLQGQIASNIRRSLEAIKAKKQANIVTTTVEKIHQNYWFLSGLAYVILVLPSCLFILWLRPLLLLRINDRLKPYTDFFAIPLPQGNSIKLPIRFVLFVGFFHYHPRVLDAWVAENLNTARNKFQAKDTVREREVHVAVPVRLDGEEVDQLSPENLRSKFTDKRACLLIWGDGGTGKTSLACQIAKWAMAADKTKRLNHEHLMLPIQIEQELDNFTDATKKPLLEAISGQLGNLVDKKEPISEELLENLLRQGRVLVIVDHFSEMSESTRNQIRPNLRDFPVNALIVTSRIKESLGDAVDTVIEPRRIEGYRLSGFMHSYLEQKGKFNLFDDTEFLNACTQLSVLVGERREITVLLAKLYAERMINSKENPVMGNRPPDNIPDLMLNYLDELNKKAEIETRNQYFTLKEDAKIIAWKCLEETYQPRYAKRKAISDALTAVGRDNAEAYLEYFEKHLCLLRTTGPAKDQIRFELDPLAEYLAALYLVEELYGEDEQKWRDFLKKTETLPSTREQIKGFLLALRDCCLATKKVKVPSFVPDELGELAGLDVEAIKREQLQRRIRRLISDLYVPEAEDRDRAATELGRIGIEAKAAIPDLIKALQDDSEDVQLAAIEALGKMGSEGKAAVPFCISALENNQEGYRLAYLRAAAVALGRIGADAKDAVPALIKVFENKDEHHEVCFIAIWALGKIETGTRKVIPALMEALNDGDHLVRMGAAWALGTIGSEAKDTVQALLQMYEDKNEDYEVRSRAVWAIGKIGLVEESIIFALIKTLENKSQDFDVRCFTAWVLAIIGSAAKAAVSTLTKIIEEENQITISRSPIQLDKLSEYFDVKDQNVFAVLYEVYHVFPGRQYLGDKNELREAAGYALDRILDDEQGTNRE